MIKKSTLNSMFLTSLALFFNVFRCRKNEKFHSRVFRQNKLIFFILSRTYLPFYLPTYLPMIIAKQSVAFQQVVGWE